MNPSSNVRVAIWDSLRIGGLLKHARVLCGLCAPTTSSYRRAFKRYLSLSRRVAILPPHRHRIDFAIFFLLSWRHRVGSCGGIEVEKPNGNNGVAVWRQNTPRLVWF
jgi:hypothetical protein